MKTGNYSGTQQTLHLLKTHVHNCLLLVPETSHTFLHNSVKSVALHYVTFMTRYFTVRSCYTPFNPFAGGPYLISYPKLLIQYIHSCPPRIQVTYSPTATWWCAIPWRRRNTERPQLTHAALTLSHKCQMRSVLWDVTLHCWVSGSWHFEGTCQHYLHELITFEDEGDTVLQSIENHSPSGTVTQQKTQILDTTFFEW